MFTSLFLCSVKKGQSHMTGGLVLTAVVAVHVCITVYYFLKLKELMQCTDGFLMDLVQIY